MGRTITSLILGCMVLGMALAVINCSSVGGGELRNLDGETVSLNDYRGNAVMLNFWASWCGPCRYEMPFFQEIYEDTKWQAAGLVIIAVNIGESGATVEAFMEANGFDFMVLLDTTGEVSDEYNVRGIPTTFFIDERGIIQHSDVGAFTSKSQLEQRLHELLD